MEKNSILHIGLDDTDSPKAMCTTYLAYKIVDYLRKEEVKFLDYPHLIRFNPNIPWKTRGNGAIAITIKTNKAKKIKKKVKLLVAKYSDIKGGANPGVVFYQSDFIPEGFKNFSELALWKLIKRKHAKQFVSKYKLETLSLGNCQGLVGAIGAIGYKFNDHTFELLTYRKKSQIGKKRQIIKDSVKLMQEKTYPLTFNSFDNHKKRVLITPHGPDPVFYGIRGEDVRSVINASRLVQTKEKLEGYMTFKTNQGTADHLKNEIDVFEFKPYTSGTVTGVVSKNPQIVLGGHVLFSLIIDDKEIKCAVYRPTKITTISSKLRKGDKIRIGGGIRKASKNHKRILNVEFLEVLKLEKNLRLVNPFCKKCCKRMKSKGKKQGFECIKCGKKFTSKIIQIIPREIKLGMYIPDSSAHRHLTRPVHRIGKTKYESKFDKLIPWFHIYMNKG